VSGPGVVRTGRCQARDGSVPGILVPGILVPGILVPGILVAGILVPGILVAGSSVLRALDIGCVLGADDDACAGLDMRRHKHPHAILENGRLVA